MNAFIIILLIFHYEVNAKMRSGCFNDRSNYDGYKLFRVKVLQGQLPVVDSLDGIPGVDVWSWKYDENSHFYFLDLLFPPNLIQKVEEDLSDMNINYEILMENVQNIINKDYSEEDCYDSIFEDFGAHSMDWNRYHDSEDIISYLRYLSEILPNNIELINIGNSYNNATLTVAHFSTNLSNPNNKPGIWIDGGMHAREWVSPAAVAYLLRKFTSHQGSDNQDIIDYFDWYMLPLANPDGYDYSRNTDRLWRKTRSLHESINCIGVDANRNFDYHWGLETSSKDPCSQDYPGPRPFSEPETEAIKKFLISRKNQIKVYMSIRAYSRLWMFPRAYKEEKPGHYQILRDIAEHAVRAMNNKTTTRYVYGSIPELTYKTTGTSDDYAMGEVGVPFVYTLQISNEGDFGYLLPKDQILSASEQLHLGVINMARRVKDHLVQN